MKSLSQAGVFILSTILILILSGCSFTSRIITEYDFVRAETNLSYFYYSYPKERSAGIETFKKTIIKRVDTAGNDSYEVFDFFTLNENTYHFKEEVFIIVDSVVFNIKLESFWLDNKINRDEESVTYKPLIRINYLLDDEVIERIKVSTEVIFRYYLGPQMITLRMNKRQLKKLQEIIRRSK